MTKREAIEILSGFKVVGMRSGKKKLYHAIYLAIKALEELDRQEQEKDYE